MELDVKIKMNEKLFLRDPYDSALGRKIVKEGLYLINKLGFEAFTFKKLAQHIQTTEAGIYRYFENKHRLLIYLVDWYWTFMEYKVVIHTANINDPTLKLKSVIRLLVAQPLPGKSDFIAEDQAYKLVMYEGSKAYLTRNVTKDNKDRLFKPYKDLCARVAGIIKEYDAGFRFPISLASTILEMSHAQKFFMANLPSLTDHGNGNDEDVISFIETLAFTNLTAR
jgi:AcrR family transcriptional regulator